VIFLRKKDILVGSIFIFLLGSLFHFTYELLNNPFVAIFSATNESIFEHTKLVLYPIIIWYLIFYFKNKKHVNRKYLFSSMIINILISIIIIPLLYYFYNGIFGIESLIIDLIIFYISIITGLKIAHKLYKNKIDLPWIAILIVILLVYIIWTYYPPQIPFFMVK
jgi:hypothetical protein